MAYRDSTKPDPSDESPLGRVSPIIQLALGYCEGCGAVLGRARHVCGQPEPPARKSRPLPPIAGAAGPPAKRKNQPPTEPGHRWGWIS